jgi:hypothetical protein
MLRTPEVAKRRAANPRLHAKPWTLPTEQLSSAIATRLHGRSTTVRGRGLTQGQPRLRQVSIRELYLCPPARQVRAWGYPSARGGQVGSIPAHGPGPRHSAVVDRRTSDCARALDGPCGCALSDQTDQPHGRLIRHSALKPLGPGAVCRAVGPAMSLHRRLWCVCRGGVRAVDPVVTRCGGRGA